MNRSQGVSRRSRFGLALPAPSPDPAEVISGLESVARPEAWHQGQELYRQGGVHLVNGQTGPSGLTIHGRVRTDRGRPCEPTLLIDQNRIGGRCDCVGTERPCGHMVALAFAWQEQGVDSMERSQRSTPWRPLVEALALGSGSPAPATGQSVLVHWIDLVRRRPGACSLSLRWRVHRFSARGIGRGRLVDPRRLPLDARGTCGDADERVFEAALFSISRRPLLAGTSPVEVGGEHVDLVLRALALAPWVRWEGSATPAPIDLQPVRFTLCAEAEGGGLRLRVVWTGKDEESWDPAALRVVGSRPPWLEYGGRFHPVADVADGDALAVLSRESVQVPGEDLPVFLGNAVPSLEAKGIPVEISGLSDRGLVLSPTPRPRLYLSEERGLLVADLRFAYGDYEISAENPLPVLSLGAGAEKSFLRRDMEFEFQAARRLRNLGFEVPEPCRFELGGDPALEFVLNDLEPLAAEWEVFGREALRWYRVNRSPVALRLRVAASIDWLDLQVDVRSDEESVPVGEVLRALRAGSRFVRLGDGGHTLVSRDWIEKVGVLLGDLRLEKGRGRVATYMAPLVEELAQGSLDAEFSGAEAWDRLVSGLRDHAERLDFTVPRGFRGTLRPYQEKGYRWLRFLGETGLGGILADDMGLGKTVQALVLFLAEEEAGRTEPNLVVAPTSVVPNWEAEARRFAPGLRVTRYHGAERKAGLEELRGAQLVVTSYAILRRDLDELGGVAWNYVLLDEAQAIKNAATQTARAARRLKARRRLTLTGTPLENHLGELWSQFHFLMPGLLGSERHFVRHSARPVTQGDARARDALARRIRPFILRRLKCEVATELPEKSESVLLCQMGPEQERLYRSLLAAGRERVLREVDQKGFARSRVCVLDALLRLRQACCHPAILPGDLGRDTPSAKFELFRDFVSQVVEEGHRVLVFTQFVKILEILRRWFQEAGIEHLHLDGRTTDRETRVRRFQEDESVSAFLVSLKAGGTGLNLTGADYVVLFDPWWNPAVEAQAADRAHRIGQTRKVFAYKLITQATVEEKILALQERKKTLTDDLIRSEEQWGKAFTEEDLEQLFAL